MAKGKSVTSIEHSLFNELSQLIEQSQRQIFSYANSTLTVLFWQIGKRINDEILKNKRGEYAKQIVLTVSALLKSQYGRNFEIRNLRRRNKSPRPIADGPDSMLACNLGLKKLHSGARKKLVNNKPLLILSSVNFRVLLLPHRRCAYR